MEVDILLVGGGVASARCARTLRRSGFEGSILLVGDEQAAPYNRPPLTKELLRDDAPDELLAAEPARWYERHAVAVLTGVAVERLDAERRSAALSDGRTVAFGRCLLATGAAPRRVAVPGGDSALLVRTLPDARALRAAALGAVGADVVVVGGGLIGVEVASGLAALGVRPTIHERSGLLWAGAMGSLLSEWALERLRGAGVAVRLDSTVGGVEHDAVLVGTDRVPAAFVVAGIGVTARDELARGAGIEAERGVVVGPDQRTSHPAVWSAGDVTRLNGAASEHWHAAREAGERAASSMLGLEVAPIRPSWAFTEVAGIAVDAFGDAHGADDERWIGDAVVARTASGRLAQLIVIGSAIAANLARDLVASGAEERDVRATLASATV